ncbi:MAG: TetR family transcriptional regulator [Microbacterium sp.]|uniref:TetR/AcrR family transcriptional regulator n=1 Tax=Microbacterium sp. TaxID=51671 RepID=UPI0039E29470
MFSSSAPKTAKSERTSARIRDTALRSFRERGYDATTVRAIAAEAGVSVGVLNYHFPSKNHLVQELYVQVQEAHRQAAAPALAASDDLIDRLRAVFATGLDGLSPYHAHAPEFLAAAVSPRSPVNPFAEDSAPALAIVESLFREAVDGADTTLPDELTAALPRALVVGHLLLALFWVYDRSPQQRKTRLLLDHGLRLLRTALPLARIPLLRRPLQDLLALIADARG